MSSHINSETPLEKLDVQLIQTSNQKLDVQLIQTSNQKLDVASPTSEFQSRGEDQLNVLDTLRNKSQKEIYVERMKVRIAEGLLSVHLTRNPNAPANPTEEEVYGELNRMLDAVDLPDPEVLGAYSPK